jgi:hypothetical protein
MMEQLPAGSADIVALIVFAASFNFKRRLGNEKGIGIVESGTIGNVTGFY